LDVWQVAEKLCLQAAQKDSEATRAKNRSFGFAQDGLGGGVLSQYIGARRLKRNEAYESFSAACWWFQRSARR